jgi:hypothetical protein
MRRSTTIELTCQVHSIIMFAKQDDRIEDKPARLTVLIDAEKKRAFEDLCASQDITASQVVRQLIRDYLARHGATYTHHDGPGSAAE